MPSRTSTISSPSDIREGDILCWSKFTERKYRFLHWSDDCADLYSFQADDMVHICAFKHEVRAGMWLFCDVHMTCPFDHVETNT